MAAGDSPAGNQGGRPKKPEGTHRIKISVSFPPGAVEELERFMHHYDSESRSWMLLHAWNKFATEHPEANKLSNGYIDAA